MRNKTYIVTESVLRDLSLLSFHEHNPLLASKYYLYELKPGPNNPFTPIPEMYDFDKAPVMEVSQEIYDFAENHAGKIFLSDERVFHIIGQVPIILKIKSNESI